SKLASGAGLPDEDGKRAKLGPVFGAGWHGVRRFQLLRFAPNAESGVDPEVVKSRANVAKAWIGWLADEYAARGRWDDVIPLQTLLLEEARADAQRAEWEGRTPPSGTGFWALRERGLAHARARRFAQGAADLFDAVEAQRDELPRPVLKPDSGLARSIREW